MSSSASGKAGPPDDAGVVDDHVEPSEPADGGVDECLGAGRLAHVVRVGDGRPAGGDDLRGHGRRRPRVRADTVHRAAEVVHDDARAPLGQQAGIGPTDAPAGAGDDGDAPVEAELAQAVTGAANPSNRASVPPTRASRSSGGRSPRSRAISSRLPRKVPSAWG